MPAVNVTVQDYSPLISYSPAGAWRAGSNDTDSFFKFYDDGFSVSSSLNATATFNFNGTGVWIYGAKRPNHGMYTTILDGVPTTHDGNAREQYQSLLFGVSGLENGEHTVQLINTEPDPTRAFLDLDFITWQSEQGTVDDTLQQHYVSVEDLNWSFGPLWDMVDEPEALSGKLLSCNIPGARAAVSFYGSSIELYGSTGKDCGAYQVTLDGEDSSEPLSCYNTQNHIGVLLYSATVDPGNHTLKIVNVQAQGHTKLALDYAVVSSLKSAEDNKGDEPPSSNNLPLENGSTLSPSVKAGIIAACVGLVLLSILAGAFAYWLRKRRNVNQVRPATERRVHLSFDNYGENMKPNDLRNHPILAAALKQPTSSKLALTSSGGRDRDAVSGGITGIRATVAPLYPENTLTRGNTTIYTVSRSATRRAAKQQETLAVPLVRGEALRVLIPPPTGDRPYSYSPSTPYAPRTSHPPGSFGSLDSTCALSTRPEPDPEMANGPQLGRSRSWMTRGYEKASLDLAFRHPPPDYWHAMSQSAGHIDK